MARPPALLLSAFSILLWAGCHSLPVSFSPPAQRAALATGNFVLMSDPDADRFIVQGFRAKSEGSWRWAVDHPVLRFILPETGPLHFRMNFTLPEATFRETGPVSLAISVNGQLLDRTRCDHAGDYRYDHIVAADWLHPNSENLVSITPDKWATPEKLAFVLLKAGFTE